MLNILFITTRSPLSSSEQDGGSTFASQVIKYIAPLSRLDVLFVRQQNDQLRSIENVHATYFIAPDASITDRFYRRLHFASQVRDWANDNAGQYDALLVQHASVAFGLSSLPPEIARKVIVVPMFTSTAYVRSGETLPTAYVEAERDVLSKARGLVCASNTEVDDIRATFDISRDKFRVIPFGVNVRDGRPRESVQEAGTLRLLYVATIKKQKNQLDALSVVEALCAHGIVSKLLLVGAIGDHDYNSLLHDEIERRHLSNNVELRGSVPSDQMAQIVRSCDLSISVSRWETFGIALFESLAMGVPAVVYQDISCLWEYLPKDQGCIGVSRCPEVMAKRIATLAADIDEYCRQSEAGLRAVINLSPSMVMSSLLSEIEGMVR